MIKPIRYDSTLESERLHLLAFCNLYSLFHIFEHYQVSNYGLEFFIKVAIPYGVTQNLQKVIKRISIIGDLLGNTIDVLTDNCMVISSNSKDLLSRPYLEAVYNLWRSTPNDLGENKWIAFVSSEQPDPSPDIVAEFFDEIVNDYDIWS